MWDRAKLLLAVLLVGCASGVDEGTAIQSTSPLISFSPMYSAFDGTHEYAVTPSVPSAASSQDEDPVMASSIKWELDPAFVERAEFPELPAAIKLITKKDGATTVAVTAKTLSGQAIRSEAKLTISRAKQSEWDAGESRYNNGEMNPTMRPAITTDTTDDEFCPMGLAIELPPRTSACGNCHNSTSMLTIEHTPTQTAGYSNEDLIKVFTQGAKPASGTFKSPFLRSVPMPYCVYKELHTWQLSEDEKRGIVWKLRSISPKVAEEP